MAEDNSELLNTLMGMLGDNPEQKIAAALSSLGVGGEESGQRSLTVFLGKTAGLGHCGDHFSLVHDVFSPVVIYFSLGCDGIISKVSEFCNTASQTPSINVETLGDTLGGGTGTDSVIDAIIVWRA